MNTADEEIISLVDESICFQTISLPNSSLGLLYILFAQLLAVFTSLAMKITPDNHCPSGEVNRVVKGVTLYPYESGDR